MRVHVNETKLWKDSKSRLPLFQDDAKKGELYVLVKGDVRFFEAMAGHVLPLGKLAAGDAFRKGTANLEVFCRALSYCAGRNIIFAHTDHCCSYFYKVVETLTVDLLGASDTYKKGNFDLGMIDTVFPRAIADWIRQKVNMDNEELTEALKKFPKDQKVVKA